MVNHRKKWGKERPRMGDFIHWLEVKGYWLRGVDEIWGIGVTETVMCHKCGKNPHKMTGWGWLQTTACMSVCDEQIKKDIPPKTSDEWDAWGR